jgi:hypothetical protein
MGLFAMLIYVIRIAMRTGLTEWPIQLVTAFFMLPVMS